MALPLSSLLPALRPHLDGLVGDRAWRDIEGLADRLPPRVWPEGSIEVRLKPGERRVDFLVCAQGQAGKEALADAFAAGARLPAGERVQPLAEEWVSPETLLGARSSILWIEHDLPEGQVGPPLLFFGGFDLPSRGRAAGPPTPAEVRALVQRNRQLLSGDVDEAQLAAVEHCTRALPPDGQVRHIAALETARPTEDVRYVAVLAYDQAWSWLQEIGWPGERRHWDLALAALGPGWSQLQIHLDVGETVRPDLGVEFFLTEPTRRWPKFIQRLVEMGVADERSAAVPEWIGEEAVHLPGEKWLSRIQRQAMIKLVLDAGGGLSAKAYLSFSARYSLF